MAIEDAVCLAEFARLADGDFERAFRDYERARYLRTARVQYEFYAISGTMSITSTESSAR